MTYMLEESEQIFDESDEVVMLCTTVGMIIYERAVVVGYMGDDIYLVRSLDCNDFYDWPVHADQIGHTSPGAMYARW